MTSDPREHYEAIGSELVAAMAVGKSKMFGMPCLKIQNKAFAGLHQQAMVFKLRGEAHARALSLSGAHLFDPSEQGRPMKEWVRVPPEHAAQWPDFAQQALAYVSESL